MYSLHSATMSSHSWYHGAANINKNWQSLAWASEVALELGEGSGAEEDGDGVAGVVLQHDVGLLHQVLGRDAKGLVDLCIIIIIIKLRGRVRG